jgi:hypothetical protein
LVFPKADAKRDARKRQVARRPALRRARAWINCKKAVVDDTGQVPFTRTPRPDKSISFISSLAPVPSNSRDHPTSKTWHSPGGPNHPSARGKGRWWAGMGPGSEQWMWMAPAAKRLFGGGAGGAGAGGAGRCADDRQLVDQVCFPSQPLLGLLRFLRHLVFLLAEKFYLTSYFRP